MISGDRLRFGLPSKGRLQTQMADFLADAGLTLSRSRVDREYAGDLIGIDGVDLVFLQAGEVPDKLLAGEIHLGLTGEDLVRERGGRRADRIVSLRALGFGHADLIVAVPRCWVDVEGPEDLDDVAADFRERHGRPIRIATKYKQLARAYFRKQGVANYRLVDSQGATEGTVAAGSAEAIVDITSSGETLRANHLKILPGEPVLRSEAHLWAGLNAPWGEGARQALSTLLGRIETIGGGTGDATDLGVAEKGALFAGFMARLGTEPA
jgi:ATP phosphoribosyltransferase